MIKLHKLKATGKSIRAISKGMSVYFVSLTHLIEDLRKAYEENRLDKRLRVYMRPRILRDWLILSLSTKRLRKNELDKVIHQDIRLTT
ncbi:ATP-binding protein [Thermoactinomyces mirandus]|uniref:ATP-binding protein n=1 Tax=Thermoactinomyces mirandus TaxID=2756294 RepID=UPI0028AA3792|nr:ATP-binding protein [Thermoactinomyces mirandus]